MTNFANLKHKFPWRLGQNCIRLLLIAAATLLITPTLAFSQSIENPTIEPAAISVNTATQIVIRANILIPNILPASVNIQLLDDQMKPLSILGSLTDNGLNGDDVAGDGIYSGTLFLNESQTGKVWLRVSVAQKGNSRRIVSNPVSVDVLTAGFPTLSHPTDLSQIGIDNITGATISSNEIISCFNDAANSGAIMAAVSAVQGTLVGRLSFIGNCYQVQLPVGSTTVTVNNAVSTLRSQTGILFAEAVAITEDLATACPFPTCIDYSYKVLNLAEAHNGSTGSGVKVAILDTGISSFADTALVTKVIRGANFTNEGAPNDPEDILGSGHGTHVAGILAATAPNARIIAVKVLECCSSTGGGRGSSSNIIAGIGYAVDRGARIINMSLGSPNTITNGIGSFTNAYGRALVQAALRNVVLIAAAGNSSSITPFYPASAIGVLGVGATYTTSQLDNVTGNDVIWKADATHGSNYGPTVQIAAPGFNVSSNNYIGGSITKTGTSMAAPFVSGAAALVLQQYPTWTAAQIKNQLITSAQPIYLRNGLNPVIDQQIGPRLDPVAAIGALRLTKLELTPQTHLEFSFDSPTVFSLITFGPQGAYLGDTQPCEARINFAGNSNSPCVFVQRIPHPLVPGIHNAYVKLDDPNVNFFGMLDITVPGMTFVSTFPSSQAIISPTRATVNLRGINGPRFATFTVNYVPQ